MPKPKRLPDTRQVPQQEGIMWLIIYLYPYILTRLYHNVWLIYLFEQKDQAVYQIGIYVHW